MAVILFAAGLYSWSHQYGRSFGWSFYVAVAGALSLIVAGTLLRIEMRTNNKNTIRVQNSQASDQQEANNEKFIFCLPPHQFGHPAWALEPSVHTINPMNLKEKPAPPCQEDLSATSCPQE